MSFLEVQFPTSISYGSSGGPGYLTTVIAARGGYESRNIERSLPLHRFNAACGIRDLDELAEVLRLFHAARGSAYAFRWKDWADYKSCVPSATPAATDQNIGTGNGATAAFQLRKGYAAGSQTLWRTIKKPVAGTVRVAVAGVEKTITTHFTVDTTTGIVTFTGGNIPTAGQAVTAGFQFDVPVRFESDELMLTHEAFDSGTLTVPLIEVRL